MNLTHREAKVVFQIMEELSGGHHHHELRTRVGPLFLDLLDAQYFASYVWDDEKDEFVDRVSLNMSDDNLGAYEAWYQYRDPITPVLQRRRQATCVSEILPRQSFIRTEFFNDFLARDGLNYGVNFYAWDTGVNIGDLRIWRGNNREDFTRRDIDLLNAIGPAFTNSMRTALLREGKTGSSVKLIPAIDRIATETRLTKREKEVCLAVLNGLSDREIAENCGISFSTVRTHLKHIYEKFGISSRNQLMKHIALH